MSRSSALVPTFTRTTTKQFVVPSPARTTSTALVPAFRSGSGTQTMTPPAAR